MASSSPAQLYSTATSTANLRRIYMDHVRETSARGRDGVDPRRLYDSIDDTVSLVSRRLRDGSYDFTQYRELLASKGAESPPRVLSVPTARDRIALRAISEFLVKVYPDAKGVIPQVRIEEAEKAIASSKFDSYIRLDVKRFYPSIQHSIVERSIRARIRKPEIIKVIKSSIATPTVPDGAKKRRPSTEGLPQGLAVSNVLSELAATPIDNFFKRQSRCAYFRFVDDILILCDASDIGEIRRSVQEKFCENGLTLHSGEANTGKYSSGSICDEIDYLGYVFRNGTISVRATSVKRIESSIARVFTRYKRESAKGAPGEALNRCQLLVNLCITGCIHKKVARGWIHYFRQMNDLSLAKRLDAMIVRFRKRFEIPNELVCKSFTRAYWEAQRPNRNDAKYIPNYDMFKIDDKREFLAGLLGPRLMDEMGNMEVEHRFSREINRVVTDLESDVGSRS